VLGKTIAEAKALAEDFSHLVQGNEAADVEKLGDAAMISGVAKFPARFNCATLAWIAFDHAVPNSGQGEAGHFHCE
ncbi:Fe-S cluster assembly sulfur transfer protein SufU, partial [Enterococcus faecalis]